MKVYRSTIWANYKITEVEYEKETPHFFVKGNGQRDAKQTSGECMSTNLKEVQNWVLRKKYLKIEDCKDEIEKYNRYI